MTTYDTLVSTLVDTRRDRGVARFHWTMAALVFVELSLGLWVIPERVYGPLGSAPSLAMLGAAAWYCWWANHSRIRDLLLTVFWGCLFIMFSSPLIELAGRSSFPLVDGSLARYDLNVTAAAVQWTAAHRLGFFSRFAYWVLWPLASTALLVPSVLKRSRTAYTFILAGAIATLITIGIFAMLPAAGPWTAENYAPDKMQALVTSELAELKAGHIGASELKCNAIISFPSFHAILAILSAFALWPLRRMRWIAVALAIAVCISTVTTGWHYGVDVLGGLLVASVSQWVAGLTFRNIGTAADSRAVLFPEAIR